MFYYYNKDHLGNNHEVVDAKGVVQQVTNYYPFGAPYADDKASLNPDKQQYKYNGKELDRMHGLNTYDYGARQHDPILGRWDRIDPLAEKYYSVSPYNYCMNNPVKNIDPDGKEATGAAIGAIAGGIIEGSYAYFVDGKTGWELVGATVRGAFEGALIGASCGIGGDITKAVGLGQKALAVGCKVIESAAIGAGGSVIDQTISNQSIDIDVKKTCVDAGVGIVGGVWGDIGSSAVKKTTDYAINQIGKKYASESLWNQTKKEVIRESSTNKVGHATRTRTNRETNRRVAARKSVDIQDAKIKGNVTDYVQKQANSKVASWIINGYWNSK